jgi:hypothetical protein
MHVHAVDSSKECKYWLEENETVKLAFNHGFSKTELRKIEAAVLENYLLIKTIWNEHCKGTPQKKYKKGKN